MLNEDLINPTLSAAVKLPYTSIPKEMTILRVFMNIHDPQLVIGTAAAIKLAFSQAPFLEIKDRFDITFIDEASQLALYVLGSLATMLPKSRMILVGDMHQLPPYMEEALPAELKRAAIGEPLTLAVKGRRWPSMHLTRVHRCPKMITEVLGDLFYGNTLTSSKPGVTDIPVLKAMGLPSRHPMVFVNYTSPQTAVGKSFSNEGEARYALQLVEALTRYASTANKKITAAILNFYGAQYSYVYSMAEDEVTVNTIDGCQGQEYDVTIVLLTRSDPYERSKFLVNANRINVALSRPKIATVIIGQRHLTGNQPDPRQPKRGRHQRVCNWARLIEKLPKECFVDAKDQVIAQEDRSEVSHALDPTRSLLPAHRHIFGSNRAQEPNAIAASIPQ
ncbi:DNA2/NAM7 helicase-like C-terminal domain-containing protein [Caenorhabditis elegans]|uniref:DNA2/NAM7 helicase-like C-terminal domain-containing protein n=1 Tax=Caenorhabditis elegans TaxID=6239 RepID=Q09594_CAEEL|nr:DNA2/NAM7 helicase-like C-terminal domain-containing protein [Caenorhabditis elegans]CAA86856.2 DNA2/NAM7 helicase-like C-terminal domain-containing protein [Caenorhabditis elegans]